MFFTECASLAEQHPDLARVFELLDSQLKAMGTAEVIRCDDLASFLTIDPGITWAKLAAMADGARLATQELW